MCAILFAVFISNLLIPYNPIKSKLHHRTNGVIIKTVLQLTTRGPAALVIIMYWPRRPNIMTLSAKNDTTVTREFKKVREFKHKAPIEALPHLPEHCSTRQVRPLT